MPNDDMTVAEFRAQFPGVETAETPVEETDTVAEELDAPVVEEEPEVDDGRKRDDKGRFVAEEAEAEPEPELILGKYKTNEDAIRALEEAQRKIGEQGSELGELRGLRDELAQLRADLKPETPAPQYDPNTLDDFFETNPQQIPQVTQRALDAGDSYLYQKALGAWAALDSVGAMDFHARAIADAQLAELRQEMAPLREAVTKQTTTSEYQEAFKSLADTHTDFVQVMDSIPETGPAGFPKSILQQLMTGDKATKSDVLETLYRWVKAEQAGTLTEAAANAAQQVAEESRAARQEAVVATSTSSPTREAQSNLDAWREQFRNSDEFRKAAGLV